MLLDLALLILRVVVGVVVMAHGAQKLFGWFGGAGLKGFGSFLQMLNIWPARWWALVAALNEFIGGLLFLTGLLSPLGALLIIANMLVAIIKVHWAKGFFTTQGGYEFPLVLLANAFALGLSGPGAYALDAYWRTSLPQPEAFIVGLLLVIIGVFAVLLLGQRAARVQPQPAR